MATNTTYNGYIVPASMASEYVRSQQNELGANKWDYEAGEININKQRALQNLSDRYSESLNDAYANYIASQQAIRNSNMGQGYQQQYNQMLGQQFMNTEQQLNTSIGEARQNVELAAQQQLNTSQQNMETEIANMNKVGTLAESYLNYVKQLRNYNEGMSGEMDYFGDSEFTKKATIEDLYAKMLNGTTKVANYQDIEGNAAQSFSEFVNSQMSEKDKEYYDWFLTKGYSDFLTGVKDKTEKYINEKKIQEQIAQEEYNKTHVNFTTSSSFSPITFEYNNKRYSVGKNATMISANSKNYKPITKYLKKNNIKVSKGEVFEYNGNQYVKYNGETYFELK